MTCDILGLDSPEHCFNRKHFDSYGPVHYQFNELGYRHGNPDYRGDEILAIGDSFTVGLGVNQAETWPEQLSRLLDYPVLNFSLNGASNDWIARKTELLLKYFRPRCVIVHYSFTNRRESPHQDWNDDERTLCDPMHTNEENFLNWEINRDRLIKVCGDIPLIHTAIVNCHVGPVPGVMVPKQVDWARDYFHYGPRTHLEFATSLLGVV